MNHGGEEEVPPSAQGGRGECPGGPEKSDAVWREETKKITWGGVYEASITWDPTYSSLFNIKATLEDCKVE
jgi:hypothetical protein